MARKLDLNTIAKEYAEGRISKEDFLYLHKMISSATNKQAGAQAQPPVLTTPAQRTSQHTQRRKIGPGSGGQPGRNTMPHQAAPQVSTTQTMPPQMMAQSSGGGFFKYVRNHHKEVVALLGTLGIFISMFYNKINTTPPDESNSRVVMVTQSDEKQSPRIRTQDIKLIAQLMMEDNSWNSELIDDFKSQWNKLSDREKSHIKKSDWYFDFSSMLSQQIKTSRTKAKTGDVTSIYNQQALLSLADSLIFGNSEKAEKLLAEATRSNTAKNESKRDSSKAVKSKSDSVVDKKPQPESVAVLKNKDQKANRSESLQKHRISRREIKDVINRFTVAFEAGHARELTDLFADEEFSSSFARLKGVKSEFRELFRNTRDRQLNLDSFFWEHDFDEARGTAKYNASVRMIDANVNKKITANVDITLRRLMGKVYITNFTLDEKRVVSSAPKFTKKDTNHVAVKEKPKFPTPAELQDLVTQYITAYETGDVTELMQLFANATWTKSRTGLVEMKQTYQDLFKTTSDREVFIDNVKWEIKGDKALGTGDLLLTLHADDKVQTKKGKIRIVARKSKDLVRFTQMFHILN